MQDLAHRIEIHLLQAGGWVSTRLLCQVFQISERSLRQTGTRPGLLDAFAVSSTRSDQAGYIHHKFLPTREWLPIKHRLRRHAIAELRRVRRWDIARKNCLTGKHPFQTERHTGQLVFL
jgi:hypothetical protein